MKGQTLIEVLIAVAIGTVIVTAILGLATRTNRNANFARASEQASKLSQQGLEVVRNIRDVNAADSVHYSASDINWSDLYNFSNDIGAATDGAPTYGVEFRLFSPGPSCPNAGESWCLSDIVSTPETIQNDIQNFTRRVFIADSPSSSFGSSNCHRPPSGWPPGEANNLDHTDSKQVTILVEWTDPVGSHESKVISCINDI